MYREQNYQRYNFNFIGGLSLCVQGTVKRGGGQNFYSGLSLCVQGTVELQKDDNGNYRFIPVCTGNRIVGVFSATVITVYPCVYREQFPQQARLGRLGGLSLCVQGTDQL